MTTTTAVREREVLQRRAGASRFRQKRSLNGSKPSASPNVWVMPIRPANMASEKLNAPAMSKRRRSIA